MPQKMNEDKLNVSLQMMKELQVKEIKKKIGSLEKTSEF